MEQFKIVLDLCRMHCRAVVAVPIKEAAKFKAITAVRGIACSFKVKLLQKLAFSSTSLSVLRRHFTMGGGRS